MSVMTDPNRRISSKEMSGEAPAQRRKTNKGRCQQIGCERTTEEDKEDVDDEAHPESGTLVLWEKRFEQSIFVDISDDDSLHLSDLQGSFRVHVSQNQGSMHSSENTGLSNSYEVEEDSSESPVSISNEHKDHGHIRVVEGNEAKGSVPYPKTPEQPRWRPDDDNTSDEDQEELPYDGELHQNYLFHTESHTVNSKELCIVNETYQQGSAAFCTLSKPSRDTEKVNGGIYNTDQPIVGVVQGQEPSRVSASVPEFLLRHFSQDELINCGRLIEAETMPEVSLLDSIDETARSRASAKLHTTSGVGCHSAKIKASPCLLEENESSRGESHTASDLTDSKTRVTETTTQRNKPTDQLVNRSGIHNQSDSSIVFRTSCISNGDTSPVNLAEDEKEDEEENAGHSCSASTPNLPKADIQSARFLLGRTRSCSELKYGQGQVHYPLPDFSKVAPKVKIPKGNGPTKPDCHTPSADRAHATAGILGKSPSSCTVDVISRVLEDSIWLTEMRKDEEKQSRLDQHLQAEYNRLLAKYPEDDNLINLMRPRDQTQIFSEQPPSTHKIETVSGPDITQGPAQTRASPQTPQSTVEGLVEVKRDAVQSSLSMQKSITEGQRLTTELRAVIEQFVKKVEEFKKCISNMSLTVEEQQKMFKGMMEALDQLERNYMSKKEEHRVLEMQNYMGFDRNTGEFDPDRQVEGEIFRLGMQLEDIKEQIDRNTHHALSLPHSSSTPTPSLHGEIVPSASYQATLHEEPVFSFSTSVGEEEEHFKTINDGPSAADSPLSCPSENSFRLHVFSQMSCTSREDEEGSMNVPCEEEYCEDFLAQLTEPASRNHQRTPNRTEDIEFHMQDPPEQHTNIAQLQRFVSPETDSGFGASDQSRPPTGLSHTQCNTESLSPSDDVASMTSVSTSDNEASHSNLHTAISVATWAGWPRMGDSEPDQLSNNVQNIHNTRTQENYTTQNTQVGLHSMAEAPLCEGATLHSVSLQEPSQEDQLAQIQKPTAVEMPTRARLLQCSCPNSEAISALQYEVSHLKRALEESLGHLPHLSLRMEHLSSMYSQEKRLRSRPRSRHQHRLSSSRCLNTDLDLQRMEDWNSSDMEPSKIKGSDSAESNHTEMPVFFNPTHRGAATHSKSPSNRRLHDVKCSFTASLESLSQDTSPSKPSNNHQRAVVLGADGNISTGPGSQHSDASIGSLSDYKTASVRPTNHRRAVNIEPTIHGSRHSAGIGNKASFGLTGNRSSANTGCTPPGESLCLMDRHFSPPLHLLHKPLLQTNYGSCNSLPPGFKVQDQQSDPEASSRRRSTQSDSAMLPSNVYFQQTSPLPTSPCKTRGRSRRQRVKEEAINRTLDKALEAALMMKQTTDRMAKTLSADLAKVQIYRKFHSLHPLSDMEQA